ncbi:MAG: PDZ domain-containing protein, partial [Steroidobacteraceae bacterium]
PSSVAGKLGLRPGDVIVAVNGTPVDSPASFAQLFETDGMPRQLDAVRDGRAIHLHL